MGGTRPNPSYEQVCTGVTGHAETVFVEYESGIIGYPVSAWRVLVDA